MAAIPTCLYYFSLLVMVEIDGQKYRIAERAGSARVGIGDISAALARSTARAGTISCRSSLIIVFMLAGLSPMLRSYGRRFWPRRHLFPPLLEAFCRS